MNGKVLVTGGHGNLGSYITKKLCECGYKVYVLTRNQKNKIQNLDYSIIETDITDIALLKQKLNFKIDYCVHTASFNEFFMEEYPKKALEINTLGTRNLLEVLSEKDIKNFIYLSTFHVYGQSSGTVIEESLLNPNNDYATTHLFAEYYIRQFGITHNLKYTILRLTNSFGVPIFKDTSKWYLVLNNLVKSAFENEKIVLNSNGQAKRDFIYMGDVARVVEKLLRIDVTNEIYNLSSGKSYRIIELANLVKTVYQKRYKKKIDIEINNNDKTVCKDIFVKNDKIKSIIDFEISNSITIEINAIFFLLEGLNE